MIEESQRSTQMDRQSADRFTDHFLEKVLSYLNFNEKFQLECVSKRLKRLVFNRATKLIFSADGPVLRLHEPLAVTDYSSAMAIHGRTDHDFRINKQYLTSIVKKCQNIREVIAHLYVEIEDLLIIGQYCPNLTHLDIEAMALLGKDLETFGQLYGHRIHKFGFRIGLCVPEMSRINPRYLSQLLKHCPNVTDIEGHSINDLITTDDQYLPKLSRVDHYFIKNLDEFSRFCFKYTLTLQSLVIYFCPHWKAPRESIIDCICHLNNLQVLKVRPEIGFVSSECLSKCLSKLSANLTKLRKLDLLICLIECDCQQMFATFGQFRRLTDLELCFSNAITLTKSDKCMPAMADLQYLFLCSRQLYDELLIDFGRNFPNLAKLLIVSDLNIKDRSVFGFAKLEKLRKIDLLRLNANFKLITDSGFCALIIGCHHIRDIGFHSRPNITSHSIEALVTLARNQPKRRICLSIAPVQNRGDKDDLPFLDLLDVADIPPNLLLFG